MRRLVGQVQQELWTEWESSKSLTGLALLMLGAFFGSCFGLVLDHRIILGAPVWLKPAKFAISSAIYAGTLAWLFRYLQVWRRFVRVLGTVTAAVLLVEVGIIDFQAARGTASHFNVGSPFDAALWAAMGMAIGILWLSSIGILFAIFRQPFADSGLRWALRLGMLITVLASATGGLMVTPTEQQRLMIAQTNAAPSTVGAHTVGARDGGPGLPVVGWSSKHGDLRIPHFLGLHALQLMPALYFLRSRRRRSFGPTGAPFVFLVSASYFSLIGVLTWQALRGQSIVQPDASTGVALGLWLALTGLGLLISPAKLKPRHATAIEVM